MKIWQRLLIAITSVAALYALWRFPPAGIATVLIGACAAWLGRGIYRSKLAANPNTKATLAAACKQSAESARASMKSYGCTF